MKKLYSLFLILQIAVTPFTGAFAEDNANKGSTAARPDGLNIRDYPKVRRVIMAENAMETESLRISLDARTSTGFVIGKICDQCNEIQAQITPETRVYHDGKEIPLARASDRLGRYATVFLDMENKRVTRIIW
jgi:hypothetical protein